MKLSKAEIAAVAITFIFIVLTVVISARSRGGGAVVTVSTEKTGSAAVEAAEPLSSPAPDVSAEATVNINTASAQELCALPGIGDVLAARIIAYRGEYGPFTNTEDIMGVSGIGAKTYEKLKDRITVN